MTRSANLALLEMPNRPIKKCQFGTLIILRGMNTQIKRLRTSPAFKKPELAQIQPYSAFYRGVYDGAMETEAQAIDNEAQLDELTFEPVRQPDRDPAAGLIPEILRRREPERTIR